MLFLYVDVFVRLIQFYHVLPAKALINVFVETPDVYKTENQLLSKNYVFFIVILVFLNISSHIFPPYTKN